MLPPDAPARMKPLRADELTGESRAFLDHWTGGFFANAGKNPVLLTFAHHPQLAERFSALNVHLLTTNTLPVKQRQIAIMRLAWICRATYMWSSHLNTSVLCGLDPDMFEPLKTGADDAYFTDFERNVIRATEELVNDHKIADATWNALMTEWDNRQMLDFLFTVGVYLAVAGVMRSTGVERQPDLLELARKYGAPE